MEEIINGIICIVALVLLAPFFILEIAWPVMIPLLFISIIRRNKSNKKLKQNVIKNSNPVKETYSDISESKLEEFDITDINLLKDYIYNIFYEFETAYNNLDYNGMYNNSTQKLYNNYYTNIMLNLKFTRKKIIDQIERKKVIVYDVLSTTRKQVISSIIEIKYVCYMQDHQGKVISGSPNPTTETFEVIFIKNHDNLNGLKCPNCGASIGVNQDKCEYCGSNVTIKNTFKIDSIKRIINK